MISSAQPPPEGDPVPGASPAVRFLALHRPGTPLLMPNPWDRGSARALQALGFAALATTSSGFAFTLGRADGQVSREESLTHAAGLVDAVTVPVSADLEHGFADEPAAVAVTVAAAARIGLAGCSIEDHTGDPGDPIYPAGLAAERVAAAVEAAGDRLVLTARAENHLHGRDDLADTISRLQRYRDAGAQVLYAPGLTRAGDIATLVAELDAPVNVLLTRAGPSVAELADLGVSRISVGGAFAFAALGALAGAARELLATDPYTFWTHVDQGRELWRGVTA